MSYTPKVLDWPRQLLYAGGIFHGGGEAGNGGMTNGGVLSLRSQAGGRAQFDVSFRALGSASRLGSWAASAMRNGQVFRVPLYRCPQLLSAKELGLVVPDSYDSVGMPWDDDTLWDNGSGWAFEPGVPAASAALEGQVVVEIDMSGFGAVLKIGHVIGYGDSAHHINEIDYDGDVATALLATPLRRDIEAGDFITFRPRLLATVQDPKAFVAMFRHHRWMSPGDITFAEAIL